ncbi:MAG: hypothetical protein BWY31_01945 [Lentisphaerae bacterium ADurb.Bin242]|nr:MAG: hypothetical protein BWY31_01945 [Lentisphaerae bacterium ADurb.Bin242]
MQGLEIRQGTVYEEIGTEKRFLLIHHNPMNLCSLLLRADGAGAPYDPARPERISVDEIIELRRSGKYRELGDVPAAEFRALLKALLDAGAACEEDLPFLEALLRE